MPDNRDLLLSIKTNQDHYFRTTEERQGKLEDAMLEISKSMSMMSITVAKMEENSEHMMRRQERQTDIDEKQNKLITDVKDQYHALDKRVTTLEAETKVKFGIAGFLGQSGVRWGLALLSLSGIGAGIKYFAG
jgi:predicted transcriptional regulator